MEKEILKILFTPEEAELAARLPTRPATLERITGRLGVPAEELAPRLDTLCERGVVMDLRNPRTGKAQYLLSPPVVGFIEFSLMRAKDSIPKKRMAEAIGAYFQGDDTFAREVFNGHTTIGRAMAHETALAEELSDVLSWERATSLIDGASKLAVSLCYCRHKAEATDILQRSRAMGLVQIADNVRQRPTYICNCCGCCCEQLRSVSRFGIGVVNPSGFKPTIDDDHCKGCSKCARACPVGAITMKPSREPAKRPGVHGMGRDGRRQVPQVDPFRLSKHWLSSEA